IALIWVDAAGQNSIVVASGANFSMNPAEVESFGNVFAGARFALFQLETPLPVVESAVQLAKRLGVKTILDPAPARQLSEELVASIDILTPNETEASLLLGGDDLRIDLESASEMAKQLLARGCQAVVLKLGALGCCYADRQVEYHVPGFPVDAVDSTAAGDVFNGALAVALAEGRGVPAALRFANGAAALSTTRRGAQSSVPIRREVDAFLKSCAS
ncbi:MAG: PfkB family carbohydrate kinase, partial [Bryobacteraceae bacterium]